VGEEYGISTVDKWAKAIIEGTPLGQAECFGPNHVYFDGRLLTVDGETIIYRLPRSCRTLTTKGICMHDEGEIYMSKRNNYSYSYVNKLKMAVVEAIKAKEHSVTYIAERHMITADANLI
jgi:hypothetical protein